MDIFKRRSLLNHEEDRFQKKIINQTIVKLHNELITKNGEVNQEKISLIESKSPPLDDSTKKKLVKNWLDHAKLNQKQPNSEIKSDSNSVMTSNQTEKSEDVRLPKLKSNENVRYKSKIVKNNSNMDSYKISKNVLQNENNDLNNQQSIMTELSELKKSNQKSVEKTTINKQTKPVIRRSVETKPVQLTRKVTNNNITINNINNHNSRKAAHFKPIETVRVKVKFNSSLMVQPEESTTTEPVEFFIAEKQSDKFETSDKIELKNE
jgi:hypothetical protein